MGIGIQRHQVDHVNQIAADLSGQIADNRIQRRNADRGGLNRSGQQRDADNQYSPENEIMQSVSVLPDRQRIGPTVPILSVRLVRLAGHHNCIEVEATSGGTDRDRRLSPD